MSAPDQPPDLVDAATRRRLLDQPRPRRRLPIVDAPAVAPELEPARDRDRAFRPLLAVWEVTLRCDLACRHCGSRAGPARHAELDTRECLDLVDQLAELGVGEVALIGGEAYLRDDWLEIVRAIRGAGMRATMTTGGRGMTLERARGAKAAGLYSASVSIDGEEEVHDRLRGVRGSHRAALAALVNLREAGVPATVNTQINRLTAPDLPRVLDRMIGLSARAWQLQLTVPMGRAADEPEVLFQPYDLVAFFPALAALARRATAAGIGIAPGNNLGYFGPFETALRGRSRKGHSLGCGAGRLTLGIEADGTIKGCPSLATGAWAGGNVRETRLREIWERASRLRYTRDRTVDELWGYCRTCYYAEECRAGCTWTADVFFGRPGNNPYCHHRALEMARMGKRERLVRVAAAPGLPFDHGLFEIVEEAWPASERALSETGLPS